MHILAVGDLRVHQRVRGDEPPRRKAAQVGGQRGRTHIDGQTVDFVHLLREHGEDFLFHPEGGGDLPVSLPKDGGELLEGGSVDGRAGEVIAFHKGGDETVEVSARVFQVRDRQCHREETYGGIQGDDPLRRLFSHHLPARAALLGDKDPYIIAECGGAGQAESLRLFRGSDQPGLLLGKGGQRIGRRCAALGVRRRRIHPDPALAAGLFPAAEGFDPHAERLRRLQDGFSLRDDAPFAGGLENDLTASHRANPTEPLYAADGLMIGTGTTHV